MAKSEVKKEGKIDIDEIKEYYERRAMIIGAIFAFILLSIAFLGFFIGFNGVDLLMK